MSKIVILCMLIIIVAQSLTIKHQKQIDINKLSDIQTNVLDFVRQQLPDLYHAKLTQGLQDSDIFRYQFINENAPITVTQVVVKKQQQDKNDSQFRIIETLEMFSGPLIGGRMTTTTKLYEIKSFSDALYSLSWN